MKYDLKNGMTKVSSSSQTVPSKILTPREILQRYAEGADIMAPVFTSDDDPDDMNDDDKMNLEIPEDDFELHQVILDESEIARAHESESSGNSDSSGNNPGANSNPAQENIQSSENQNVNETLNQ